MKFSKYLLLGVIILVTQYAIAAVDKNVASETVLTPGARLVMGDKPDEDFTILRAGEAPETKPAPPLPQKNPVTGLIKPVVPSLPIEKTHKHLFQASPKVAITKPIVSKSSNKVVKHVATTTKRTSIKVSSNKTVKSKLKVAKVSSHSKKKIAARKPNNKIKLARAEKHSSKNS